MTVPRLLLILAVALAPAEAIAQPLPPGFVPPGFAPPAAPTISYEGYEVFRWLLHRAELKPFTEAELRQGPRSHTDYVVIVLGSPHSGFAGNNSTIAWFDGALSRGGAVLIAYDDNASLALNSVQGGAQLQFSGWRVAAGDAERFGGRPDSPFAEPVVDPALTAPEWDVFGGDTPLTRVASTNPGSITAPPKGSRGLATLAEYPAGCRFANRFGRPATDGFVFAVGKSGTHATSRQPFRFLALADQATFHNGLLISPDENGATDNLEFAARAVNYLTEDAGQKKRTKCLLIENGRVVSNYDDLNRLLRPPMPLPKLPPWDQLQPKLIDFGNQIIDRVQENDVPNKLMTGANPERPNSLLRNLLAVALVAAALWATTALVRRVWGARTPTDVASPPPGGRPPPPPDGGAGVFGRRGKELAGRDNLLEPARAAARDLFDAVGGPPDPGSRLPKVVISDAIRRPETLRQALRDLWAIAYGRPAPVTAMRWAALEPLIARSLAAHRDGKWRFVESGAWGAVPTRLRGEA